MKASSTLCTLDEFGLSENTLVVFTSDNGGEIGVTTNALRAGKSTLYEGGEPVIMRWPCKNCRITEATPIITTDYYPTFLEVVGVRPDRRQALDGVSLVPLFKGSGRPARYSTGITR